MTIVDKLKEIIEDNTFGYHDEDFVYGTESAANKCAEIVEDSATQFADWIKNTPFNYKNKDFWYEVMNFFKVKNFGEITTKQLFEYFKANIYEHKK